MATIDNFAVFILTHGRPDRVITYDSLKKHGYTGPVYIVIDNEDKTSERYRQRFGDQVIIFDKLAVAQTFDTADNFDDRQTVVFARNACFQIAEDLGLDYFLQLDDDYTTFGFTFNASLEYAYGKPIHNLDRLFQIILAYYQSTALLSIAMAQRGDLLGGSKGRDASRVWLKRKCMNTFFCSTERPFQFVGRVNEDVNTYVSLGNKGKLFFTFFNAAINQVTTQASSGGMSSVYLNEGTYIKSFYPVMYQPSSVRVSTMKSNRPRLHHRITWANTVPCILDEKWRKSRATMTGREPILLHEDVNDGR